MSRLIASGKQWFKKATGLGKNVESTSCYLIEGVILDLEEAIGLYKKMNNHWRANNSVDLRTLIQLKELSLLARSNGEWMDAFFDRTILDNIETYFRCTTITIDDVCRYKSKTDSVEQKFKSLLEQMREAEPSLTPAEAFDRVETLIKGEADSYRKMFKELEQAMIKLFGLEIQARTLKAQVKNLQESKKAS